MIFNTFINTLPSLGNIGLLLILLIFIYSVLGIEFFPYIRRQDFINDDANFRDVWESFMTLFRVSTGEGWNFVMDDMSRPQ